ncbi:MAG TPA: OsmC family protein [Chitinophagales bacterium]|nr:OsmC family protein [Chitinophagales bacterium]
MESHLYNVNVKWSNDRKGVMQSPELDTTIDVATPPQFNKGMPGIWSPEHLFTAAVSSCFMTTFLAIAENFKLEFESLDIESKGVLEQVDGKFLMTKVLLYPKLVIKSGKDKERAERVLHKSEAACLISNSVKATVEMTPEVLVNELSGQV